ncbi:hypothetical protein GEU84_020545 [Fertoebacter nigrum]|uniref:Uncharacterized protein n=1 Tax=Fertoeibacter niger TaxID=2656921 RepID=A0A8X8H5I5_9RHOB|nr:hypothetical protein [Fertoeibacter niger]NUB46784.1 hypothetical protein [Fertoeibacter niger]
METDPETALLVRIYQLLDVPPACYWHRDLPEAAELDLAARNGSNCACQPVNLCYTDLSGQETAGTFVPRAFVHPPQGVKLFAWCEERRDFRQLFVGALQGPTLK